VCRSGGGTKTRTIGRLKPPASKRAAGIEGPVLAEELRELILRRLGSEGKARASDLALRLAVSLDAVRRDLQELAAADRLRRVHGGALPPAAPGPDGFVERLPDDIAAKAAIAQAAVALVWPGEVVALSGATTALEFARRLPWTTTRIARLGADMRGDPAAAPA
jgi:DeoR/GlpR family transcriptional regulator of sugar metabolism